MMRMATNCVSDSGDYCANTLPKPIHLVKRSNAGKTIELLFSGRFFHQVFVCWKSCRKYRCWSILSM